LSHEDLGNRTRYLNAKHTIEALLEKGVIPIINENDSVTVEEIKIGDNDTLSATVACLVDAQLLIIFSDVEGLYDRDPSLKNRPGAQKAQLISHISRVNEDIERIAGKSNNRLTVGGMITKVLAAKKTMSFGIPTLVVNGLDDKVVEKIFAGKDVGTLFWSGKGKIRDRKHWIAHTLKSAGTLTLDEGARKALVERGKSLLPAGLIKVQGKFEFGSALTLIDESGAEIGRGLVNYNSRDLDKIKGMKTTAVRSLMGESYYEEVIHRDDLVVFDYRGGNEQ
jgi:glutamate 5-kinase